jgi:peptide/nickel transport system permease protein
MGAYFVRRVLQGVVVIFGVMLFVYVLERAVPGGAARAALGRRATAVQVAAFNHANDYDRPPWVGFYHYCKALLLHFDLGYSYRQNEPVATLIGAVLPKTIVLVGLATLLSFVAAIVLGTIQVLRPNRPLDHLLTMLSFVSYATPSFLVAQLLILYFAVDLHWVSTEAPQSTGVWGILSDPRDLVLPVVSLSIVIIASLVRFVRSSMLDQLAHEYVRTARAKGASELRVVLRHVLRNAAQPLVTIIGLSFPAVVGGAVIIETVFNFPGMGLLTTQAATNEDVPLLLGTTFVAALAAVVGSLVADLLYGIADPRIHRG